MIKTVNGDYSPLLGNIETERGKDNFHGSDQGFNLTSGFDVFFSFFLDVKDLLGREQDQKWGADINW